MIGALVVIFILRMILIVMVFIMVDLTDHRKHFFESFGFLKSFRIDSTFVNDAGLLLE